MSWSNTEAKEFLTNDPIHIMVGGKIIKAAISRDPSFDDANLIVTQNLRQHDPIVILGKQWKIVKNVGLGRGLLDNEQGYRVYSIVPEIELKENDKIKIQNNKHLTVKKINKEEFYFSVKEDPNLFLSLLYPEEYTIIT